jgi:hypothetical protein
MDPAELAELKAGMRANTEMIAVIGADRDKLAIEHAKLKATVEAKDKENKDLVTQLASLANAESIAQASQALAMMPAYINDETLEQKLLLPKDMFVTSHSVHAALCKNNPDLAFVKEKVGELIRLSGNYIAGIIAAMEQRKNKYTFCEVYYEITRAAALMYEAAGRLGAGLQHHAGEGCHQKRCQAHRLRRGVGRHRRARAQAPARGQRRPLARPAAGRWLFPPAEPGFPQPPPPVQAPAGWRRQGRQRRPRRAHGRPRFRPAAAVVLIKCSSSCYSCVIERQ